MGQPISLRLLNVEQNEIQTGLLTKMFVDRRGYLEGTRRPRPGALLLDIGVQSSDLRWSLSRVVDDHLIAIKFLVGWSCKRTLHVYMNVFHAVMNCSGILQNFA